MCILSLLVLSYINLNFATPIFWIFFLVTQHYTSKPIAETFDSMLSSINIWSYVVKQQRTHCPVLCIQSLTLIVSYGYASSLKYCAASIKAIRYGDLIRFVEHINYFCTFKALKFC